MRPPDFIHLTHVPKPCLRGCPTAWFVRARRRYAAARCVRGCIRAERNAAQTWAKEMIQWRAPILWRIKVIAIAVNDAELAPTIQISTGGGRRSTNPSRDSLASAVPDSCPRRFRAV